MQQWTRSTNCLSWMNLTDLHPWRTCWRPLTHWHVIKLQGRRTSHQKPSKSAKIIHLSTISMSSSASAGMKARSPNTVTLYKKWVTEVIAIITVAYHSSALLRKPSHAWFWRECSHLQTVSTLNLSSGLELTDQPLTWYFRSGNSRKNAENSNKHCSLPLSTWPKLLILLVKVIPLHYFKELNALLNSSKDQTLSWQHARHSSIWWLIIWTPPNQQWGKAGLCTCTYTFWHFLLTLSQTCIWVRVGKPSSSWNSKNYRFLWNTTRPWVFIGSFWFLGVGGRG